MTVSADWGGNGLDSQFVQVPKAKIHPLVFIPGFLGTWPSEHGGKPDPLTKIYDNLLEALERAGYERGLVGDGSTLNIFGYDWRQRLSYTGQEILKNDVAQVISTDTAVKKSYGDYAQVSLITHSAGGLVARAYVEHRDTNNEQNVYKLITLAGPHQGIPGAYRGWFGGDPRPLNLSVTDFQGIAQGLALCDKSPKVIGLYFDPPGTPERIFSYLKNNIPSVPQLLPATGVPDYLVENVAPFTNTYPFNREINTFIDDLNDDLNNVTGIRDFDVTKLNTIPQIISSYSSSQPTDGIYRVITTTGPPLWEHGEPVTPYVQVDGDALVPDYSGNLLQVVGPGGGPAGNVIGQDESTIVGPLSHVSIMYEPAMVRRVISYVTDIDITNNNAFWNAGYASPTYAEKKSAVTACSPVRVLVIDSMGRRAGLDLTTGQKINEIPGAFVTNSEVDSQLIILPEITGQYQVQGIGIDEGDYRIGVIQEITTTLTTVRSLTGTTTVGEQYQFTFDTNSGLLLPEETGGQVVLEAEQFTYQLGRSNQTWLTQTTLAGYIGSSYLTTLPDKDQIFTTTYKTTSPELQYRINFNTIGVYYVWLRGYAPNGAGDSVYVALDDQPVTLTGFTPRIWSWAGPPTDTSGTTMTIDVPQPGIYTLRLWQREDGIRLDRIILTTDSNYVPTGNGPSESVNQ